MLALLNGEIYHVLFPVLGAVASAHAYGSVARVRLEGRIGNFFPAGRQEGKGERGGQFRTVQNDRNNVALCKLGAYHTLTRKPEANVQNKP